MRNEPWITHLADEWKNALRVSSIGLQNRSEDERIRYWDAQSEEYDLRMFQDYRRIDRVLNLLNRRGFLNTESRVLDLGCGTGTYSLELARRSKQVIALDRSASMGLKLLNKARKWGISNVKFLERDWNSLDVEAEGLSRWSDVTVSALNPAINSWEALDKINQTAHGACVMVTFAESPRNTVREDIKALITDAPPQPILNGYNVLYPFNLLYAAGYRPEVSYVPMHWVKEHPPESAVHRICAENMISADEHPDLLKKIETYVMNHLDSDGIFREHNDSLLGILFWQV